MHSLSRASNVAIQHSLSGYSRFKQAAVAVYMPLHAMMELFVAKNVTGNDKKKCDTLTL